MNNTKRRLVTLILVISVLVMTFGASSVSVSAASSAGTSFKLPNQIAVAQSIPLGGDYDYYTWNGEYMKYMGRTVAPMSQNCTMEDIKFFHNQDGTCSYTIGDGSKNYEAFLYLSGDTTFYPVKDIKWVNDGGYSYYYTVDYGRLVYSPNPPDQSEWSLKTATLAAQIEGGGATVPGRSVIFVPTTSNAAANIKFNYYDAQGNLLSSTNYSGYMNQILTTDDIMESVKDDYAFESLQSGSSYIINGNDINVNVVPYVNVEYRYTMPTDGGLTTQDRVVKMAQGSTVDLTPRNDTSQCVFTGWYTNQTYTTKYEGTVTATSDMTLYGLYEGRAATTTFDPGYPGAEPIVYQWKWGDHATLPAVERPGYMFQYWSGDINMTEGKLINYTGDKTFTAIWSPRFLTIDFDSNGGSVVPSTMKLFDQPFGFLNPPTKAGNIFEGWYSTDGTTLITADTVFNNVDWANLKAKWFNMVLSATAEGIDVTYDGTTYSIEPTAMELRNDGQRHTSTANVQYKFYAADGVTEIENEFTNVADSGTVYVQAVADGYIIADPVAVEVLIGMGEYDDAVLTMGDVVEGEDYSPVLTCPSYVEATGDEALENVIIRYYPVADDNEGMTFMATRGNEIDKPTAPGKYIVEAQIPESDNYNGKVLSREFQILEKEEPAPENPGDKPETPGENNGTKDKSTATGDDSMAMAAALMLALSGTVVAASRKRRAK